jgi:hypothetical protein
VQKERLQHGAALTVHHVVSALTFGFWEHLATKRFERFLWSKGLQNVFKSAPSGKKYVDLHDLMESVRRWRNRIAHHRAIYDNSPMWKHQQTLELLGWACPDTSTWIASISKVPLVTSLRPK